MDNLTKSIHYLQQSIRHDYIDDTELLNILDKAVEFQSRQKILNEETVKRSDEGAKCN